MGAGKPGSPTPIAGYLSAADALQQVLDLGEGLLYLTEQAVSDQLPAEEALRKQKQLLIEAVAWSLQAEAAIWLQEAVVRQLIGRLQDNALPEGLTGASSSLMRACLERRSACLGQEANNSACWTVEETNKPAYACAVPVLIRGLEGQASQALGALQAIRSETPFNADEIKLLEALAIQAALAWQASLRLAEERWRLQRRASQLATVYEVSSAITSVLDQDRLLNEVVDLIQKRFGYPFVHLFSVHPGRRKIFYEAGGGSRSQLFVEQQFAYDLDAEQGMIVWAARHGETALANDVSQEPRYLPSPLFDQKYITTLFQEVTIK